MLINALHENDTCWYKTDTKKRKQINSWIFKIKNGFKAESNHSGMALRNNGCQVHKEAFTFNSWQMLVKVIIVASLGKMLNYRVQKLPYLAEDNTCVGKIQETKSDK